MHNATRKLMLLLGRDQKPSTIRCIHKYKYNS